jgi:hypothetical protein
VRKIKPAVQAKVVSIIYFDAAVLPGSRPNFRREQIADIPYSR